MQILIIVNDDPEKSERPVQALRLAHVLSEDGTATVRLFLLSDGAWCAVAGRKPLDNGRDMEWMMRRFLAGKREVAVCQSCMEARGITDGELIEGASRGSMGQLARWTCASDRVLVF